MGFILKFVIKKISVIVFEPNSIILHIKKEIGKSNYWIEPVGPVEIVGIINKTMFRNTAYLPQKNNNGIPIN